MLKVKYSNQFKKDYKLIKKRGYDVNKLKDVIKLLSEEKILPAKYKDHYLTGNYKGFKECHIRTRLVTNLHYWKRRNNTYCYKDRDTFWFI